MTLNQCTALAAHIVLESLLSAVGDESSRTTHKDTNRRRKWMHVWHFRKVSHIRSCCIWYWSYRIFFLFWHKCSCCFTLSDIQSRSMFIWGTNHRHHDIWMQTFKARCWSHVSLGPEWRQLQEQILRVMGYTAGVSDEHQFLSDKSGPCVLVI